MGYFDGYEKSDWLEDQQEEKKLDEHDRILAEKEKRDRAKKEKK